MTINEILNLLKMINPPEDGFRFKKCSNILWGKSDKNEIVFAIENINDATLPFAENTKYLKLYINHSAIIENDGKKLNKKISAIILKTFEEKYVDLFLRLTLTFVENAYSEKILQYFIELKDLFANSKKPSANELQGMYGELFTMYLLKEEYGIDVTNYYQKEDRRKFDFSVSDKKKIDVKTTIKPERIHHFLQMQLDTDRYDIKIISIMLQKDDVGTSLYDLITYCKNIFSNNLQFMIRVEKMIMNIDKENLMDIKYNWQYSKDNIKLYDAISIPRLKEKNEEGVFNVEYDVDFSNSKNISSECFINWLKSK